MTKKKPRLNSLAPSYLLSQILRLEKTVADYKSRLTNIKNRATNQCDFHKKEMERVKHDSPDFFIHRSIFWESEDYLRLAEGKGIPWLEKKRK